MLCQKTDHVSEVPKKYKKCVGPQKIQRFLSPQLKQKITQFEQITKKEDFGKRGGGGTPEKRENFNQFPPLT